MPVVAQTIDDAREQGLVIRLFGTFEARIDGRPLPRLRTRKGEWLLALLCLKQAGALSREWLAEALWPDSALERSAANLRLSLCDLRRALGSEAHRVHSPLPRTLQLDISGCTIDLWEFDAALARGDEESLEAAVALYRGRLLEACLEPWAEYDRQRCEQACMGALESLAVSALERADPARAEPLLRRILQIDPLRESAYRSLLRAQAMRGDMAAAIQTYRDLRILLHNELNVEPGPETIALFQELKEAAESVRKPLPEPLPERPPVKLENPRNAFRLPRPLTEFVGREQEVRRVASLVPQHRLVTLTGPGGIGKTRMAIEVAQHLQADFPEGVCFADLAPIADGNRVGTVIANALGALPGKRSETEEDLLEWLRDRRALVVLDNCEHVVEACAEAVETLLSAAPNLFVLATSRQALGITGEIDWRVPPLALAAEDARAHEIAAAESVRLFLQRARSVRPDFVLSASNARAVAHVCDRLDGIPLALELAAARLKILSIEQVEARLDDRFALLSAGSRTALPRHRTLEATLDWSFALLSEPERLLLLRLSVFPARFNLEAADAVCGGPELGGSVLDLLGHLADKSLVSVEEEAGEALYRLLESTRVYARERLDAEADLAALRDRHAAYFLAFAEHAQPMLSALEAGKWLDRLEMRSDDFRLALAWYSDAGTAAEHEAGLRLATALWPFWHTRHDSGDASMRARNNVWSEAVVWLEKLLAGNPPLCAATATAQELLGVLTRRCGLIERARELFGQSLATSEALGDRVGAASVLRALAAMHQDLGENAQARDVLERSLELSRSSRNPSAIAQSLTALGAQAFQVGDIALSLQMAAEALSSQRELGHLLGISFALTNFGVSALAAGDWKAARAAHEESLAINETLGHSVGIAWSQDNLAEVALAAGELDRAGELYRSAVERFYSLGHRTGVADCLVGAAEICLLRGRPTVAASLLAAAKALRHPRSRVSSGDRERFERLASEVAARRGPNATLSSEFEGKRVSLEEALQSALQALPDPSPAEFRLL